MFKQRLVRILAWIINLSEGPSPFRGRFSLSPSAYGREGTDETSYAEAMRGNTEKQNEKSHERSEHGQPKIRHVDKTMIEETLAKTFGLRQQTGASTKDRGSSSRDQTTPDEIAQKSDQAQDEEQAQQTYQSVSERREKRITSDDTTANPQNNAVDPRHPLPASLAEQETYIRKLLHAERNADMVFAEHFTAAHQRVLLVYSSVTVKEPAIEQFILQVFPHIHEPLEDMTTLAHLLPCANWSLESEMSNLPDQVIAGKILLFMGFSEVLTCSFAEFKAREIGQPVNESIIRGPQEAFTEDLNYNMSIMRRVVHCKELILQVKQLQDIGSTRVCVMHISGFTNPKLVDEVNRRLDHIGRISLDAVGIVMQLIEDHPYSILPTSLYSERPDFIARYLYRGCVAIIVENKPLGLLAPTTFLMQIETSDDLYQRFWYVNFLRVLRVIAIFNALLLPGLYIALVNFQQEMIPSDLMLTIYSARQNVPFPTIIEVLILELGFELIREASLRVPKVIGPTVGIVGALILGQSAVQADLVTPLVVILISITGLSSYSVPNVELNFSIRYLRFIFTFMSWIFGLFGLGCTLLILLIYLSSMQSFGVPYLTPLSPYRPKEEGFFRKNVIKYDELPGSLRSRPTLNETSQKKDRMAPQTVPTNVDSAQGTPQERSQDAQSGTADQAQASSNRPWRTKRNVRKIGTGSSSKADPSQKSESTAASASSTTSTSQAGTADASGGSTA
ncbi:spore germination protein [Ferroacidibacillus organovorans]|uniref:Spore germination protein n=1 Tax=Ferroacidibacillus organovorans TaxID=1765683 RepID=A0A1V4EXC7_9BACL|nr:spore germination protein [Ferroacidibacillus organovorans]OPG17502.1 hypothetical protein B2M26_01890 [Ferroacidibacillus organovorans]